jgi:hypothetical protein
MFDRAEMNKAADRLSRTAALDLSALRHEPARRLRASAGQRVSFL